MKNTDKGQVRNRAWALLISVAMLAACGPEEEGTGGTQNNGADADITADAGGGEDAGVEPGEDAGGVDAGEVDAGEEDAGEEDAGEQDADEVVLCAADERVVDNACEACPAGTTNEAGDDASGEDTECEATLCGEDERVVANACEACAPGTTNAAGGDASGADTVCTATLCGENEYVSGNACVACGPGSTNMAGDDASGVDTTCDGELCASNERVVNNACEACPPGSINGAGDDASGPDTACNALICIRDTYVLNNACTACPTGSENDPGDDATGPDTACDVLFCPEDQYVSSGACVACPPGTINAAGDDASGADTQCDPVACRQDEYVSGNACVACPLTTTNDAGDDASGADTTCDDACVGALGVYCFELDPAYIKASNTGRFDQFGLNVDVSGDTMVVAAHVEDGAATGVDGPHDDDTSNSGAVYVFVRGADGAWSQQAYLKASNTGVVAMGIDGPQSRDDANDSGAAYVFTRSGTTWSQQAYLKASNTGAGDKFGWSVAVDGDTVVVGAHEEDSGATGVNGDQTRDDADGAGAAYVFVRNPVTDTWRPQAYLKASSAGAGDNFGWSVDIDAGTVAVGAFNEDGDGVEDSGVVYVFKRASNTWYEQARLKASNAGPGDRFGGDVAVSGETLAASAVFEDSDGSGVNGAQENDDREESGAVYVFVRDETGAWFQQAYLKTSSPGADENFGNRLDMDGDRLVVGASNEDGSGVGVEAAVDDDARNAGAAYVFGRDASGVWSQLAYVKASNTEPGDGFGISVAISDGTLAVGAFREASNAEGVGGDQDNNTSQNAGAVYAYDLAP